MNVGMWLVVRILRKRWFWKLMFSKLIVDGDDYDDDYLCWWILTCKWRWLWWCMHVLKNVDVDCWFVVWTCALSGHMFMHS